MVMGGRVIDVSMDRPTVLTEPDCRVLGEDGATSPLAYFQLELAVWHGVDARASAAVRGGQILAAAQATAGMARLLAGRWTQAPEWLARLMRLCSAC